MSMLHGARSRIMHRKSACTEAFCKILRPHTGFAYPIFDLIEPLGHFLRYRRMEQRANERRFAGSRVCNTLQQFLFAYKCTAHRIRAPIHIFRQAMHHHVGTKCKWAHNKYGERVVHQQKNFSFFSVTNRCEFGNVSKHDLRIRLRFNKQQLGVFGTCLTHCIHVEYVDHTHLKMKFVCKHSKLSACAAVDTARYNNMITNSKHRKKERKRRRNATPKEECIFAALYE